MTKTIARGFKYALFPNDEQKHQIAVNCGCSRFIYNKLVRLYRYENDLNRGYAEQVRRDEKGRLVRDENGKKIIDKITPVPHDPELDSYLVLLKKSKKTGRPTWSANDLTRIATTLRSTVTDEDGHYFLKDADSTALGWAARNFQKALVSRFNGIGKAPRFKQRVRMDADGTPHGADSYKTAGEPQSSIDWEHKRVRLLKLGWVKFDAHRTFEGHIASISVQRNPDNTYSVSFTVPETPYEPKPVPADEVGVITGISTKLAVSNGTTYDNPTFFTKAEKRLARQQRRLARKVGAKKGETPSKSFERVRQQIARTHAHIAAQRKEVAHQISNDVIDHAGVIHIVKPEAKRLQQSAKRQNLKTADGRLTKTIVDTGAYQLYEMIRYKADWNDRVVIEPTETDHLRNTCPVCGHVNETAPKTGTRRFICESCGYTENVDVMAARAVLERAGTAVETMDEAATRRKAKRDAQIAKHKVEAVA